MHRAVYAEHQKFGVKFLILGSFLKRSGTLNRALDTLSPGPEKPSDVPESKESVEQAAEKAARIDEAKKAKTARREKAKAAAAMVAKEEEAKATVKQTSEAAQMCKR